MNKTDVYYLNIKRYIKRVLGVFLSVFIALFGASTAYATNTDAVSEGIYYVDASLSCYINAMGGVEFGAPLLTDSVIEVDKDGNKTMNLYFGKNSVTIYSVTCDTFIDFSPSYSTETNGIKSGTIGFYEADGTLNTEDVDYTLSDDTAENARQEQVHYVDSISFPITYESDTYYLSLYVNSNVMGQQFTKDGYQAILTVDWSSLSAEKTSADTESDNAVSTDDSEADNSADVEVKDGLNIHHADGGESSIDEATTEYTQTVYFNNSVIIAVCAVAAVLILGGVVLISIGRKERHS